MRAVDTALVSSFFDTFTSTARTSSVTGRVLQKRPFASSVCISCQFRGSLAPQGRGGSGTPRSSARLPCTIRRWQSSGSVRPSEPETKAETKTDNPIEERLRRAREEYTMKELRARVPPPSPPPVKMEPIVELEGQAQKDGSPNETKASELAKNTIPPPPLCPTTSPSPPSSKPVTPQNSPDTTMNIPGSFRERLPSHIAARRSELISRLHIYMDLFLSSLALASQRLNTYTGTDYSGISSLRDSIATQERLVKSSLDAVSASRDSSAAAFAAQSASQKEVVQLLERKHSWSATDLERYMSLIRSEHVNEQAVQAANDDLSAKEGALGVVRSELERSERRLYHEEQIWSDTIRRNSTWVTFGLMGFNVILLLASLLVFEPWRRRRIVREIKTALDDKTLAHVGAPSAATTSIVDEEPSTSLVSVLSPSLEATVDATILPTPEPLEKKQSETSNTLPSFEMVTAAASGPELMISEASAYSDIEPKPASTTTPQSATSIINSSRTATIPSSRTSTTQDYVTPTIPLPFWADTWTATWTFYQAYWADLFSERRVALRKVDLTATALEGAAAGAAFMGLLFVLLRPR